MHKQFDIDLITGNFTSPDLNSAPIYNRKKCCSEIHNKLSVELCEKWKSRQQYANIILTVKDFFLIAAHRRHYYKNDLVISKPQIFVNLHTNILIQSKIIVNGSSVDWIIERSIHFAWTFR